MYALSIPGKPSDYYHAIVENSGETVYTPNRENLCMLALAQHSLYEHAVAAGQSEDAFIKQSSDAMLLFIRNEPTEAKMAIVSGFGEEMRAIEFNRLVDGAARRSASRSTAADTAAAAAAATVGGVVNGVSSIFKWLFRGGIGITLIVWILIAAVRIAAHS